MFSGIFQLLLILTTLTRFSEALWAVELKYTGSITGYQRIFAREVNEKSPEGVVELNLGEVKRIGPLERKDFYRLELFAGSEQGEIVLNGTREWTTTWSAKASVMGSVDVKHRMVCHYNWYGPDCDVFCETRASHRCNKKGQKICYPGTEGEDCTPVVSSTASVSPPEQATGRHEAGKNTTADTSGTNYIIWALLITIFSLLIVLACCAKALLRRNVSAVEPLLPVSSPKQQTPPRLAKKALEETKMEQKDEQKSDKRKNFKEMDSSFHRPLSLPNTYSSPPSIRKSSSEPVNPLPEILIPLEEKIYASIHSPDTPKSSRTMTEVIV